MWAGGGHGSFSDLGLVGLVAAVAVVGPLVGVGAHVLPHVTDGLVEFATLAALVAPLTQVHLHVLLQQVARQELLLAHHALKRLVACETQKTVT